MRYIICKRILDLVMASLLVGILLIPSAIIFILVLLDLREFPLYLQVRNGLNGKLFTLVKFKTMMTCHTDDLPCIVDARTTPFTRILRTLRLDEIPQLYNILRADMSFIGPRPLLPEYYVYGTDRFRARYAVRPGIMGLAQLYGGEFLSFARRLPLDIIYIRNMSFYLDAKILFMSLYQLVFQYLLLNLIYQSDQAKVLPKYR